MLAGCHIQVLYKWFTNYAEVTLVGWNNTWILILIFPLIYITFTPTIFFKGGTGLTWCLNFQYNCILPKNDINGYIVATREKLQRAWARDCICIASWGYFALLAQITTTPVRAYLGYNTSEPIYVSRCQWDFWFSVVLKEWVMWLVCLYKRGPMPSP